MVSLLNRQLKLVLSIILAVGSVSVSGQDRVSSGKDATVGDVAKTPLKDLNLSKDEIPQVLLNAVEAPYVLPNGKGCASVLKSVRELDEVLGPDYDVPLPDDGDKVKEGRVAQKVVGSLIPFRNLVRRASGAAEHERQFTEAIMAGLARRGYLKGVGQARGCAYPARPARGS